MHITLLSAAKMTSFKINLGATTGTTVEYKKHVNQRVILWADIGVFVLIFWSRIRKLEVLHNTDKAYCSKKNEDTENEEAAPQSMFYALRLSQKPDTILFQQGIFMAIDYRQQQSLYFGLQVKCHLFFSDFNLGFYRHYDWSPQYKDSQKFVLWAPS